MKLTTTWKGKMLLEASDGTHSAMMDAKPPFGQDTAMSPKQLLLAAITGCTGVDVISLLRKHKQDLQSFSIAAEADPREEYPKIFKEILLDFFLTGAIDSEIAIAAVADSQSKYCSVSAMVSKASPIRYRIYINDMLVHEDQARFAF